MKHVYIELVYNADSVAALVNILLAAAIRNDITPADFSDILQAYKTRLHGGEVINK